MFFADSGNDRVQVVGPSGLLHFLASMRTSLARYVPLILSIEFGV